LKKYNRIFYEILKFRLRLPGFLNLSGDKPIVFKYAVENIRFALQKMLIVIAGLTSNPLFHLVFYTPSASFLNTVVFFFKYSSIYF